LELYLDADKQANLMLSGDMLFARN